MKDVQPESGVNIGWYAEAAMRNRADRLARTSDIWNRSFGSSMPSRDKLPCSPCYIRAAARPNALVYTVQNRRGYAGAEAAVPVAGHYHKMELAKYQKRLDGQTVARKIQRRSCEKSDLSTRGRPRDPAQAGPRTGRLPK